MKYIVLSFDDGRKDFYTNAYPVLKKYNLPATLNVITEYIGRNDIKEFDTANHECVSWENIFELYEAGIEIANHSADHTNELEKIREAAGVLKTYIGEAVHGFASPNSDICDSNFEKYRDLLTNHEVQYIRSGRQIRRDGLLHTVIYIAAMKMKSGFLYKALNMRNIIDFKQNGEQCAYYPSVTCCADNNCQQVLSFLNGMKDDCAAIIMFHSILHHGDSGWGKDRWYNSVEDFEAICHFLSSHSDYEVITNAALHRKIILIRGLLESRKKEQ